MLDRSVLKTFRVLVATPCFSGNICLNYVLSIINLQRECTSAGMGIDFYFNPGDSLVTRARNDCVAYFLANPQFTHLFWIDADIGFAPEGAFRLILSDHDIAAGAYPIKREDWPAEGVAQGTTRETFVHHHQRYPVNTGRTGEDVEIVVDRDGFIRVREAPTGFMLIKRAVLTRMAERYPELKYVPDWPEGSYPEGGVHYRFFDTMTDPESGRYLSEDYAFCRLWERLGGHIFIDANTQLSHEGRRVWQGDFPASLRNAPHVAVGAPKGLRVTVKGLENLKRG